MHIGVHHICNYSTDLRSSTQGKGEFAMEYKEHLPVTREVQERLVKEYQKSREEGNAAKK